MKNKKEIKEKLSIRIRPSDRKTLEDKFGSVGKAIDFFMLILLRDRKSKE